MGDESCETGNGGRGGGIKMCFLGWDVFIDFLRDEGIQVRLGRRESVCDGCVGALGKYR